MSRIALWKKVAKNGNVYFEGNIENKHEKECYVVLFKNNKTKENQPDYRLYKKLSDEESTPDNKGLELLASLWKTTSKNGKSYLSGYDKETETAWTLFNNKPDGNKPVLTGERKKEARKSAEADTDIPFEF